MKTLLLVTFATLAYAASDNKDVPIEKCAVSIKGVKRPSVSPSLCTNTYAKIPCEHLYYVADNSSYHNASKDFVVSSRCYTGPLQPYAHLCSSQCALCCEHPDYNCTDKLPKEECQLFPQYNLCGEVDLYDFLNYNCRQSCGFCHYPEFNKTLCQDSFKHCNMLFGLVPCSNPFMQQNCQGTCFITEKCGSTVMPTTTKKPTTMAPTTVTTVMPTTTKKPTTTAPTTVTTTTTKKPTTTAPTTVTTVMPTTTKKPSTIAPTTMPTTMPTTSKKP